MRPIAKILNYMKRYEFKSESLLAHFCPRFPILLSEEIAITAYSSRKSLHILHSDVLICNLFT